MELFFHHFHFGNHHNVLSDIEWTKISLKMIDISDIIYDWKWYFRVQFITNLCSTIDSKYTKSATFDWIQINSLQFRNICQGKWKSYENIDIWLKNDLFSVDKFGNYFLLLRHFLGNLRSQSTSFGREMESFTQANHWQKLRYA